MVKLLEKKVKCEFAEVKKIEGSGEYRFATIGDWDGGGSITGHGASNSIFGQQPKVKYDDIPEHLKKKFPNSVLKQFLEANLEDGEYERARFNSDRNWNPRDAQTTGNDCVYLVCGRENYSLESSGTTSGGEGNWNFEIQDIGNLSIVKNKLVVAEPIGRDGKLSLRLSGSDGSRRYHVPDHWRAWIDYEGEHPGKLVEAVVDYINAEKMRLDRTRGIGAPLWKK